MWRRVSPGAAPRLKSYSASSGYVYEYYFADRQEAAYRFLFSATRDRFLPVTVDLDRSLITQRAGRELSAVEEYAVAKMSLFQAFDARPDPSSLAEPVRPGAEELDETLRTLDLL
jgi:hypothetical protein